MTADIVDRPTAAKKATLTRRRFLECSAMAVAGMALYSGEIARHEISVVRVNSPVRNLPPAFENFRVAQISDIHFDEFTEPFFLHRVLRTLNALQPDLVLLTGDFISFGATSRTFVLGAMEHCADILREITCPQRFAVMGNHDSFLGAPTVGPILAASAIPLLVNQQVPIERGGERIWLCGIHDPITHVPDLDAAIPQWPDGPVLLMSHGPDYADTLLAHPRGKLVDMMFSGHTHGGQVRLPLLPPMHLPSGGRKYVEGLFELNRLQLYVSRGIGTVGVPFRLNCPPEITLFTLHKA
jgi:predicted MPP superfamily phosphohydrolase